MVKMTESINTKILWRWSLYCILGCVLLPNLVMSSRYLPTRRSIPTQIERNERLKELFEHILESERDAHLSAASKYADQLNMIQKSSIPERVDNLDKRAPHDFTDDPDDSDYDERPQYEQLRKQTHFHHRQQQPQPWRIELQNYARGLHRNTILNPELKTDLGFTTIKHSSSIPAPQSNDMLATMTSLPRSHTLLRKIQDAATERSMGNTNSDNGFNADLTNDLNWLASNSELHGLTDYDALYDDVNENKRSTSSLNRKFDHYRRNDSKQRSVTQPKMHLE